MFSGRVGIVSNNAPSEWQFSIASKLQARTSFCPPGDSVDRQMNLHELLQIAWQP
jgi:hypothetical protein